MKKVFSLIVSLVLCILCYPAMIIESAVIEPKLVHTERWTTSYYIDDDEGTLYPYIECRADIYSNGYVYLYMWNTHEWSGYDTIYNDVTIIQSVPYSTDSIEYNLSKTGVAFDEWYGVTIATKDKTSVDVSYYPAGYYYQFSNGYINGDICGRKETDTLYYSATGSGYISGDCSICQPHTNIALCNLHHFNDFDSYSRSGYYYDDFRVNDQRVLTKENTFRLYGHEFTITPEMLSQETPTESVLVNTQQDELEKYKALYEESESKLKELEADNEYKDNIINTLNETITALESQVEHWKKYCGDCDDDGRISISDSIILNRYLAGTVDSLPCSDPPPLAPEDDEGV